MGQARDEAGNIWEVDAQGNPVRLLQQGGGQAQGTIYAPPADPYKQTAEVRANNKAAIDAGEAQRRALEWAATHNPDGSLKMAPDAQIKRNQGVAEAQGNLDNLNNLAGYVASLRQQYAQNFKGKGIGSLVEYAPAAMRPANGVFNDTANSLLADMAKAKGLSSQQFNTPAEQKMFFQPLIPQAGDTDEQIVNKLDMLDKMVQTGRQNYANQIVAQGAQPKGYQGPNAMNQPAPNAPANVGAQGSALNALTGNTRTRYERNPDLERAVAAAFRRGASLEELNAITIPAGYGPINAAEYMQAKKAPKNADITFTVGKNIPLSRMEELSGSPLGAAGIGLGNAGSFGLVKGLAPDQYAEADRMNGGAMLAGEVLGAIGGTSAIGKLGANTAGKMGSFGQKLLQGGGRAGNLARGVGTDVAYSAAYGAGSGDGAAESALAGGLGSLGGRAAGKLLGKAVGGLTRAPGAQELADRGIPLTVGQNMGGMVKGIEDRAAGYPIIGDIIGNRRLEGMQGFNQAAFNDAGQPIGAQIGNIGEAGVNDLRQATSGAYDSATAGVNVPLDAQFMPDLAQVAQQSRNLPPDLAQRFNAAMDNRVQPIAQSGQMTGETYQQGMRGLSGYKAEMTKPGFEGDYRDALSGAQDVLKSQMMRGGGASVVEGLGKADRSYRLTKVLQDAVSKAKNGTGSGEIQTFTPAQLNMSAAANAKKFGGQRPFASLIDAGQQVLPSKIPDSGTAGRLAQLALPGLVAGGAGTGYATGGGDGATTGGLASLGLLAALAAGGTKGGQKAINKLLFNRPGALRGPTAKRAIGKLQGLFGAASVPLALEAGN